MRRRRREPAKPNPHLYLAALELLDVPAGSTFAIEDSPNGIRAAKAAGIPCVCVPNEATAGLDLSEADLLVPTFEGLDVEDVWNELGRRRVRFDGVGSARAHGCAEEGVMIDGRHDG